MSKKTLKDNNIKMAVMTESLQIVERIEERKKKKKMIKKINHQLDLLDSEHLDKVHKHIKNHFTRIRNL